MPGTNRWITISVAACCMLQAGPMPRSQLLAQPQTPDVLAEATEMVALDEAVGQSFVEMHAGWSADDVLLRDDLNARFIVACQARLATATVQECNWTLLNLRKAKRLTGKVTQRERVQHGPDRHAAEIAARWVEDRYGLNLDRAMCDPESRREFDRLASELAPGTDPYLLRKAAVGLRKARRLRPELIARVTDWGRTVSSEPLEKLRENLAAIPNLPGIYIFRDESGYLYIGEAGNLRDRLTEHLRGSDRVSLGEYLTRDREAGGEPIVVELHAFAADSPARKTRYRRAYESELIASRQPRFNVRP